MPWHIMSFNTQAHEKDSIQDIPASSCLIASVTSVRGTSFFMPNTT